MIKECKKLILLISECDLAVGYIIKECTPFYSLQPNKRIFHGSVKACIKNKRFGVAEMLMNQLK